MVRLIMSGSGEGKTKQLIELMEGARSAGHPKGAGIVR